VRHRGGRLQTLHISTATAFGRRPAAGVPVESRGPIGLERFGQRRRVEALGPGSIPVPRGRRARWKRPGHVSERERFHPAMPHVAPGQTDLGVRTLFNWLGPLSNPARPDPKLLGVADGPGRCCGRSALAAASAGLVVHGTGGMVSFPGGWKYRRRGRAGGAGKPGRSSQDPSVSRRQGSRRFAEGSGNKTPPSSVGLSGERGPKRDALILNAAAALWIAGRHDLRTRHGLRRSRSIPGERSLHGPVRVLSRTRRRVWRTFQNDREREAGTLTGKPLTPHESS